MDHVRFEPFATIRGFHEHSGDWSILDLFVIFISATLIDLFPSGPTFTPFGGRMMLLPRKMEFHPWNWFAMLVLSHTLMRGRRPPPRGCCISRVSFVTPLLCEFSYSSDQYDFQFQLQFSQPSALPWCALDSVAGKEYDLWRNRLTRSHRRRKI